MMVCPLTCAESMATESEYPSLPGEAALPVLRGPDRRLTIPEGRLAVSLSAVRFVKAAGYSFSVRAGAGANAA